MAIHGGIMEAYLGHNEDEWRADYDANCLRSDDFKKNYDEYARERAEKCIRVHTPLQRLEIYLEWNGILGWTETIWDISQGKFEV